MKENSFVCRCIEAKLLKGWQDHVIKRVLDLQAFKLSMANCSHLRESIKGCTFAWVFDNLPMEAQCSQLMPSSHRKGYVFVYLGFLFIPGEKDGFGILAYNSQKRHGCAVMFDAAGLCSWLLSVVEIFLSKRLEFQIDSVLIT